MNLRKCAIIFILFLLVVPLVLAVGVTPGRKTLNYQEGMEQEIKFTVMNNENKELNLAIYARGGLAPYIEIPLEEVTLSKDEASRELTYKVKLPELTEPGLHTAEIVIREITAGEGKEIMIGAMQAVITQLHVYVPYPGKYIVARLDIVGGKVDKKMLFFVPLTNFGEEDVNSAKAEIIIMDMYQKVINKVETDEQKVPGEGRAELSAQMDPSSLLPGIYRVIAAVTYDGFSATAENTFYIKDFLLIPLDISIRDFTLGEIAQLNILIENIGNVDIKDAYSLLTIDKDGKNIVNLKSVPIDFKPLEKKEMVSYWDTKDVLADEYQGTLMLRYEDKTDERGIRTIVGQNSIRMEIIGVTGYAIKEEAPAPKGSPMIILVILLVIINVGWFVFYFMKKK